jgi:hypothetical protein
MDLLTLIDSLKTKIKIANAIEPVRKKALMGVIVRVEDVIEYHFIGNV